ncbi:S1C family serine protease [Actinomadura macrotermitis]|uniref:PDZ domain-containing protein n=1 Tax=Actinomadura macrotermitis TaxID=2585200 RepID=A0A7K0BR52_9ACTN|nr:trypsin-like peptidase domain-containing protein [Actinomadura macrotermitis]MQY03621.1 hypothetical protein [Actinomadura macrotermitis]
MTEQNRGPVKASSEDDDLVPGFGPEEPHEEKSPGEPKAEGPQPTVVDQEIVLPEEAPEPPGKGDRLVAGFAPPDAPDERERTPAPQDDPPPVMLDKPLPPQSQAYSQQPPPPDARPRPGFVPHDQQQPRQGGAPYGWGGPPQGHQQPPPAPPGPGGMPYDRGPWPASGYGQPPGGPNWSPVPPPPSSSRGGPGLGVLAVMALIVALVAGGVGAGIGVMASGDDNGRTVSLGGSTGAGPAAKNRPPDSVAGVAQKVLPSVVMIRVRSGQGEGTGTGFIVNGGYIITNNHVVSGAEQGGEIQVVFNDKKTLPATIKGRDPGSDIAVLKPSGQHSLPALAVGDSDALAVGDPVIAIGSPLGLQGSVTTGIISSMNRAVPTRGEGGDGSVLNAIQTDAAINPGNSGGPLVDAKGQVIGVNTAIATLGGQQLGGEQQSGSIGLGFAIPINQAKRVAEEIINHGSARRAQLGIGIDTGFPGPGVRITDRPTGNVPPIVKGGPADKAGLKPGDVIVKMGDQPIESSPDLLAQVRSHAPGDKVKLTYQRGGKETTVELTLGAAN